MVPGALPGASRGPRAQNDGPLGRSRDPQAPPKDAQGLPVDLHGTPSAPPGTPPGTPQGSRDSSKSPMSPQIRQLSGATALRIITFMAFPRVVGFDYEVDDVNDRAIGYASVSESDETGSVAPAVRHFNQYSSARDFS